MNVAQKWQSTYFCLSVSVSLQHMIIYSALCVNRCLQDVRSGVSTWLFSLPFCVNRCLQDVRSGVGKLLNYVNSVKRLADIRDAVWDIVAQVCTFEWCYIWQVLFSQVWNGWLVEIVVLAFCQTLVSVKCVTWLIAIPGTEVWIM